MKRVIQQSRREPLWFPLPRFMWRRKNVPNELLTWLLDNTSLTTRLVATCRGQFGVKILQQAWQRPDQHERATLNMGLAELGFVRQVHLLCDGVPWVFARTIIPQRSLTGRLKRLTFLGTRPLGAVLFANPNRQRSHVEIACIRQQHAIYRIACQSYSDRRGDYREADDIWGRRSLFKINAKPILVSEVFLTNCWKNQKN